MIVFNGLRIFPATSSSAAVLLEFGAPLNTATSTCAALASSSEVTLVIIRVPSQSDFHIGGLGDLLIGATSLSLAIYSLCDSILRLYKVALDTM